MSNIVSSAIFCFRNSEKVENGDFGRAPVAIGQARNAINSIMEFDGKVAKTAKSAVDAFKVASESKPLLKYLGKGISFFGNNINPLICASSGIKVLTAEDKEAALITQSSALGAMFLVEGQMKKGHKLETFIESQVKKAKFLKDKKGIGPLAQKAEAFLEKTKLKGKLGHLIYGGVFVLGSLCAYNFGEKIGNELVGGIRKNSSKFDNKA